MPKPSKPQTCPAWFYQAAEQMVRNNLSFKQAALDIGLKLDPDEALRTEKRKDWQEILRSVTNRYHSELANDPSRTKSTAIGRMWALADKLEKEGENEKAAQVIDKIAKMEGWSGAENNVNIFSGLTARDIAEAKERIQERSKEASDRGEPRTIDQLPIGAGSSQVN